MRSEALRSATIRVGALRFAFLPLFLLLAARAGELSIIKTEGVVRGKEQIRKVITLPAARGFIVDRNQRELALTIEAPSLFVRPNLLPRDHEALNALASITGTSQQAISNRIGSREGFVYIDRWLEDEAAQRIEHLNLPGVGIEYEHRRTYPAGPLAARLIGFSNIDHRGERGVEQMLDEWLRGHPQRLEAKRDARGRPLSSEPFDPREAAGGDVALALDAGLQAQAEKQLALSIAETGAAGGMVIAVEPQSGDILTLAEWPSFDPNDYRHVPYPQSRSRAFHDALEPGSTFKSFLVAGALESGLITTDSSIDTGDGTIEISGKTIEDHRPYGIIGPGDLLRYSSNVGSVLLAQELGPQKHRETLSQFGFGRRTLSGFPGESAGMLRDWRDWRNLDQATVSYGQGVNVTPIQLAMATAALANRGQLMRPRIVIARRRAVGPWESVPPVSAGQAISPETADIVVEMLESVVSSTGTARKAALAGVRVAGKTGTSMDYDATSRSYRRDRYTAWFMGIAPADDPKVAIVVILENLSSLKPHTGGGVAGPLFARVAAAQLARHGIITKPEPIPASTLPTPQMAPEDTSRLAPEDLAQIDSTRLPSIPRAKVSRSGRIRRGHARQESLLMPDFVGEDFNSARSLAASRSLELQVSGPGAGRVIEQLPVAGSVLRGERPAVRLVLATRQEEN